MNTGTVNKKYVSALTLQSSGGAIDVRQIMKPLLNITNEELSFLDVMELQGRKEVTATPTYHSGANVELFQTETISSSITVTTASPQAKISFTIANTYGNERVRAGDLIYFPSGYTGYVESKSESGGTVTLVVRAVGAAVTSTLLAAANTQKIAVFSNASGEGSGSRENLRVGLTTKSNQVTKWKDNYEISDVEKANQIEFTFNGQPYFMYKSEYDCLMRFRANISYALLLSEKSSPNWSATSPDLFDGSSNPVQTTQGLRRYIKNEGINYTGVTIGAAHYAALARSLAAARTPKDFMVYQGVEGAIAHDDFAATIASNALSTNAQLWVDGKSIDLGLTKMTLYGYNYTFVRMPMLDHSKLMSFSGGADFHKEIYYVPEGKIKTMGGGEADRIRFRYMPMKDGGMIFESNHGRLAPVPNGEEDIFKKVYSCNGGLEVLGAEHFVLSKLA